MRYLPAFATVAALGLTFASPGLTQSTLDGRVARLEGEMRAVQRKVFPDGAGRAIQPELTTSTAATPGGSPAASPVSDLQARVTAVEAQLRTLTGQVEQNGFKLRQLEQAFEAWKAAAAPLAPVLPAAPVAAPSAAPSATSSAAPSAAPAAARPATPAPKATSGSVDVRKAAVAAIERPDTGNAADDAYTYGFRLWTAKFYPEAQVQLKATVDQYAASSIASRASNLLGRAYLDDGKPALASVAFYENYQKRPKGDRAADSLAWLGEALIQLKKLPDACKVYSELEEVYGATLRSELRTLVEKGRARAKCAA